MGGGKSSLSFVFADFFGPTDRELFWFFLFFQHFLGQKLFLFLSSGLPPSVLSPEASNPQRFTQTEEPAAADRSRTHQHK